MHWHIRPQSHDEQGISKRPKYIIEDTGKIPSLTAFYKLFLTDIKVKILTTFWCFLMDFWMCPVSPSPPLRLTSSVFSKWKVARWCIWASFNDIESVALRFSIFKCFCSFKLSFLGCFPVFFWPELPKNLFCLKFWPVMTYNMMHQICYSFYWSIKKWSKLGQKLSFWLILRGFLFMLSYTQWYELHFKILPIERPY